MAGGLLNGVSGSIENEKNDDHGRVDGIRDRCRHGLCEGSFLACDLFARVCHRIDFRFVVPLVGSCVVERIERQPRSQGRRKTIQPHGCDKIIFESNVH